MLRAVIGVTAVCILVCGAGPLHWYRSPVIYAAQDDWKTEFADICSKTEDPMALSAEEIKSLIDRCDKLKPRIEKLDESTAKVYLRRLKMCKDLFVYVLESKTQQPNNH